MAVVLTLMTGCVVGAIASAAAGATGVVTGTASRQASGARPQVRRRPVRRHHGQHRTAAFPLPRFPGAYQVRYYADGRVTAASAVVTARPIEPETVGARIR